MSERKVWLTLLLRILEFIGVIAFVVFLVMKVMG